MDHFRWSTACLGFERHGAVRSEDLQLLGSHFYHL
jgi:hypothetical protein